jgi:hypothetical protein
MATPKYLEVTTAELERIKRNRSKSEGLKVDAEQLFIAEFGKHFGWGGVQAILNNEIDPDTASYLIQGARKVDARYSYDNAHSALIGSVAAQSKKPSQVFKKATGDLLKSMKADI